MGNDTARRTRKKVIKQVVMKLHHALSADAAVKQIKQEMRNITPEEMAEIEQSLIDEGLSRQEMKEFYNVYAQVLPLVPRKSATGEIPAPRPVIRFKSENQEVANLTNSIRDMLGKREEDEVSSTRERLKVLLEQLKGVRSHYQWKEALLFPSLRKRGLLGLSQAMTGKDNEIVDKLKAALEYLESVTNRRRFQRYVNKTLEPLLTEIEGMIFAENNILFPISLEKLGVDDWDEILEASSDIDYVFLDMAKERDVWQKRFKATLLEEPVSPDNEVLFPTGGLSHRELMFLLNTLPFDMTFVDSEDKVRYFSEGKDRVFGRERVVIGQPVQDCHQLVESLHVVEKILASFKDGSRDSCEFWINHQGKLVHIRYFAVREKEGQYLGTLEVMQDVTGVKKLKGEKRLLDEKD